MRLMTRLTVALIASALLAAGAVAMAQDKPADPPMTEQIAKNHEARQKGEPVPYPDAENELTRQQEDARSKAGTRVRRPESKPDGDTPGGPPAISPGGAAGTPAATAQDSANHTRVALTIGVGDEDWGTIVVELFDDKAPQTVANFLRYVDSGFYNGTIFHRVKPRYIAQGGGFIADLVEKTDGLQPPVANEAARSEKNKRGTIAVARSRHDPNSGTSQFFFNLVDNPRLDQSGDNPGYCAFGRITDGLEVLEKIATQRVRRSTLITNEVSQPMTPPQLKVARRLAPGEAVPAPAPPAQPDAQPATPPEKPGETGGGESEGKRDGGGEQTPEKPVDKPNASR